jgi:hypothetical protein
VSPGNASGTIDTPIVEHVDMPSTNQPSGNHNIDVTNVCGPQPPTLRFCSRNVNGIQLSARQSLDDTSSLAVSNVIDGALFDKGDTDGDGLVHGEGVALATISTTPAPYPVGESN